MNRQSDQASRASGGVDVAHAQVREMNLIGQREVVGL